MSMNSFAHIVTTNNTATGYSLAQASPPADLALDTRGNLTVTASGMIAESALALTESELMCQQFYMKIEDLVNLWLAKYGNEWVDVQEVLHDNYYKYVYKRLKTIGELEQHYLTDRSKFVCRKPD